MKKTGSSNETLSNVNGRHSGSDLTTNCDVLMHVQHKQGNVYSRGSLEWPSMVYHPMLYQLSRVGDGKYALINISNGNLWSDPVETGSPELGIFSEEQFTAMTSGNAEMFEFHAGMTRVLQGLGEGKYVIPSK